MYFNEELKPGMRGYIKNTAWTGFVYGLAALVFGVFAVITPSGTLSVFVGAIGFLVLVHGAVLAAASLLGIKRDPQWYIGLVSGLLQLLLGLFIITRSENISNTALMLSTVGIGLVGIFTGTFSLISAIRYRDIVSNVWPQILRGGLLFIVGVSMLLAPFGFGTAMVRTVGVMAALFGIFQLWTSFKLVKELN